MLQVSREGKSGEGDGSGPYLLRGKGVPDLMCVRLSDQTYFPREEKIARDGKQMSQI